MDNELLICHIRNAHPEIDNLSERTWNEVTDAIVSIVNNNSQLEEAAAIVFRSISGQIRHEISCGLKKAIRKQAFNR